MKKVMLAILALAVLSAGSASFSQLSAQSITGTWQGALKPPQGRELRMVFKISTGNDDKLKALLYNVDQRIPRDTCKPVYLPGLDR